MSSAGHRGGDEHGWAGAGERAGRRIEGSRAYRVLVAMGLTFYGLMHIAIGGLAVRLALGDNAAHPSGRGAMRALSGHLVGEALLWIVGVGFGALALWQLLLAWYGYREYGHRKRDRKRLASAGKVVLYLALGASAIRFAVGADSGSDAEKSLSARLLEVPGGIWVVIAIGVAIGSAGGTEIYRGIRRLFNEDLNRPLHGIGMVLAMLGLCAKGISLLAVALLFCWAALTRDASHAGGMDKGLAAIKTQPFGEPLLLVVAGGIACYGVYCLFWARHPRVATANA